jgi:23S rRNA (adenine-N6)-dimethyltransferase
MSRTGGRHELGQNFLTHRGTVDEVVGLVAAALAPHDEIVEIGAGHGALTRPLAGLGHPLRAIEIDPRRAHLLDRSTPATVSVEVADALCVPLPTTPHVLVGNLPFHLTTALVRHVLRARHWHTAVLLTQWEVARRRAGVGGASMLTASWWPWYTFTLHRRVPATAFTPAPSVDGGILTAHRRPTPLVTDLGGYQELVRAVFTGRGRGLVDILARTGRFSRSAARVWVRDQRVPARTLPKHLTAEQWASLWAAARTSGDGPGRPGAPGQARRMGTCGMPSSS